MLPLATAPAAAQTAAVPRAYVNVNGFLQGATGSFGDTVHPIANAEQATVTTTYEVAAAPGFDAGAGVRVWRRMSVGVDVSWLSKGARGSIAAQMPHPFYFNRPRAVSGDASDLTRVETAVHAQVAWTAPLPHRWQLVVSGGPSWFMLDQDLVNGVVLTETYPFDTAAFGSAAASRRSGSALGFNAGGDFVYMLRTHVGVGFGVAVVHGTAALTDTASAHVGGVHAAGGVRLHL
jgi:hypothetical protein